MTTTAPLLPLVEAPVPDVSDRLRLSFSRVESYRQCPLQFRFSYLDKLPGVPSPHLSWGTSLHSALETWWMQKLPTPPPVEDLLQALYDSWEDDGFEGMPREEKLEWYRHAQDVLRRHHARYASTYVPAVASEQYFVLDIGDDIEVAGSVDHVARTASGGIGIVDWKTNKRAKTKDQVRGSLQLAIYTLAAAELWGQKPEWVALDFVVPGVRVTVERDEIDTDAALTTLREVAGLIRAEAFAPTPNNLCGWCDYRSLCPAFEGEGPDVAGLAVVELKKLHRQRLRDEERITHLEELVRTRLGPNTTVTVGTPVGQVAGTTSMSPRMP